MVASGILHPGILTGRSHIAEHVFVVAEELIIQVQAEFVQVFARGGDKTPLIASPHSGKIKIYCGCRGPVAPESVAVHHFQLVGDVLSCDLEAKPEKAVLHRPRIVQRHVVALPCEFGHASQVSSLIGEDEILFVGRAVNAPADLLDCAAVDKGSAQHQIRRGAECSSGPDRKVHPYIIEPGILDLGLVGGLVFRAETQGPPLSKSI